MPAIKCDREKPCASCRIHKFECTSSPRRTRTRPAAELAIRQRYARHTVLANQYANQRTSGNSRAVIQPKTSNEPAKLQKDTIRPGSHGPHTNDAKVQDDSHRQQDLLFDDADANEFDGGTSLHAHSIAARDILFEALGSHTHLSEHPKMVAALSSLRQLVETDKTDNSAQKPRLAGLGRAREVLYQLKLPPTDAILEILRKSKERKTFTFSPPMAFVTRDEFHELCKAVFFRTDDYSVSTAVIVHCILENLLHEFEWIEEDRAMRQKYKDWTKICAYNLEMSISNLDLLLPASMQNAQALLLAASYCMEKAQISICKKLVIHGCMMVQSLGWHRASSLKDDTPSVQQQKRTMFWMLYIIDKNLSLRLGQASLIQDYDIDLPLPEIEGPNTSAMPAKFGRINRWVEMARIMDQIYQRLYSPGALRQSDITRFITVQDLLQQVENIRPKGAEKDDLTRLVENPDFAFAPYVREANTLVHKSDEVHYHSLLCIIYRATPPSAQVDSNAGSKCIESARNALDCHENCAQAYRGQPELWAAYLHWTVLNTPFIPFTTLFSHVITSHDLADLRRLQMFAESMSGSPTSQAAYKVSRVASVFVTVAAVYIESNQQKHQGMSHKIADPNPPALEDQTRTIPYQELASISEPACAPFDPFLNALGFADDPLQHTSDLNLENWFSGNQHLMGLLENDLSYLDDADMIF